MWWTTDNRAQRQPIRFVESSSSQTMLQAKATRKALKRGHSKLPISTDQALANLRLQESGADCTAEVPRLRKDIRSLEVALRKVVSQSNSAASVIDELQVEKRQQLQQINQLVAELQTSKTEHVHAQLRTREEGEWLILSADLTNRLGPKTVQQKREAEEQVSDLKLTLAQLRSDNRNLSNLLELASRENSILSSVISDMESRHERELHQSREQTGVLQNRLSQNGAADRSQVQQLNIRIVSQAAEIRSLQKQVKDLQSSEVSTETEYETILNDQPMSEKSRDRALNERLERSLQAARIELDAAVHELNYAHAESNRLREYAKQIEQQYDSEFHHVVQVAELHAIVAEMLEQSQESAGMVNKSPADRPREDQAAIELKTVEELVARNEQLTDAWKQADAGQIHTDLPSEQLALQAQEFEEVTHELDTLRELQASLSGENETLTTINQELEQRLAGLTHQLSETEQARSDDKTEWKTLLDHHEGGAHVANAECRFLKGQLDDQRAGFESKLKQHLEVIQCLNADVGAARRQQVQLEKKLEGEILNRQLAEQEIKLVKQEAGRMIESLSTAPEELTQNADETGDEPRGEEPGDDASIRAAA
ncbi:MAG: hypothetical protein ACR2OA_20225 [Rubripirellula sp.]